MTQNLDNSLAKEIALDRQQIYGFFANFFNKIIPTPGSEVAEDMLAMAKSMLEADTDNTEIWQKCVDEATELGAEEWQKQIAIERTRLCRGTLKEAGVTPPQESVYSGGKNEKERLNKMQDIHAMYAKADLQLSGETRERSDYIGVEFNFMVTLILREIEAIDANDEPAIAEAQALQKEMILDHLAVWVPIYCKQAEGFSQTAFYKALMHMINMFIADEATAFCEA